MSTGLSGHDDICLVSTLAGVAAADDLGKSACRLTEVIKLLTGSAQSVIIMEL